MTTKTKLSALALAAAAFTTTLAAGGSASANIVPPGLGHGPVVAAGGATGAGATRQGTIAGVRQFFPSQPSQPLPSGATGAGATRQGTIAGVRQFFPSQPSQPLPSPGEVFKPLPIKPPPVNPPSQNGGSNGGGTLVSCHPGTGCTVTGNGDHDRGHDHDRDHDRDYDRDHDHDGYYRPGYGWGYQPPIVVGGVPAAVAVPAPVQAVPAPVQAVPARVSAPAAQVVQASCNCLTKQNLPDGSVLFQDNCTKESAIAVPPTVGAR